MNKKIVNTSFIYAILAIISGVFYREFTKFNGFIGTTALSVTHVHLFMLGTFMFLTYNIEFISTVVMFYIRGILQVKEIGITNAVNGAISGFAGISHMILGISIIMLFLTLKKVTTD